MMANVPVKFLFEVSNNIGQYEMQTADCRPGTKCRLHTQYKMQTDKNFFYVRNVSTFDFITYQL